MSVARFKIRPIIPLAAIAIVAFFLTINASPVSAAAPTEPPGPVPCFEEINVGTDSINISWAKTEGGGKVQRWIVWLDPDDGSKGVIKRPQPKKREVTFRNLNPGDHYHVYVRGKNKAGKGPRLHVEMTVNEGNMFYPNKFCD